MAKNREYRELFDLNSVFLTKEDLFVLEKLLIEDNDTDEIEIRVNFDSTSIDAESFGELFENTDLPDSTDKLSINMRKRIDSGDCREISSGVSLSLHYNHINCQIHSCDQTWFLGKKAQVEKYFKSKKPWYLALKKLSTIYPMLVVILIFYSNDLLAKDQYLEMLLPVFFSVVLCILTVLEFKQKLFPFVKVNLQDKKTTKFGFNECCALVGALAAIATMIQFFSTLFK